MSMSELEYRHELKHYITYSDYLALRQRLLAVAQHDKNAGAEGGYKIRSLYFDNLEDKALREKLEGVNDREKFRIRMYNDDRSFIRLEKKSKKNGLGNKRSAKLTPEECQKIIDGDIVWMGSSKEALLVELYAKMKFEQLRPKTIVDYVREPFIFPQGNVRVTIDSQIETGIQSKDMLESRLPTIRTNRSNIIILEVKFDEYLPGIIRDAVQLSSRSASAFSKYAVCRMFG